MTTASHINSLEDIVEKVLGEKRLSREDGIRLIHSHELATIGYLADMVRKRKVGDYAYFLNNHHINHSNICLSRCSLCAFSRLPGQAGAYTLTSDQVVDKAVAAAAHDVTEVYILGGNHPELRLEHFEEMFRRVKERLPGVAIKGLTPTEVDHISRLGGLDPRETLIRLKNAGMGMLSGGGAEMFSARVRRKICPGKATGERWLEISRLAHEVGIPTTATMLYGQVETLEERIDHLLALRELQDETGGIATFIPLPFHPTGTGLAKLPRTTAFEDLKMIAIARLMLDNFPHITAFWFSVGEKIAQIALSFGADDLYGPVYEELIVHAAGAEEAQAIELSSLVNMIKSAGRIPAQRDTFYRVIREGF
ncbi:MAG: CofH family radical SAM protein [Dehalococcoidia bacterium]|nr:CofH family radical SAM protein [Dehalococcoidia bacterium]